VAVTPGSDFEDPRSGLGMMRIRISYSRGTDEVTRLVVFVMLDYMVHNAS